MEEAEEPQFMAVDSNSDDYRQTIKKAQATLNDFKVALESLSDDFFASVKFFIPEAQGSDEGAFLWLMHPFFEDGYCFARPFELPEEFTWLEVGQWIKLPEESLMDWYILTDSGDLSGGYSLRYQRNLTPDHKKHEYDERIGVKKYL